MTEQMKKSAQNLVTVDNTGDAVAGCAAATTNGSVPSKTEQALKLLRRKRGATIAELQAATGWQAHSVRGSLSGTVKKKLGLKLSSERGSDQVRRYTVAKA
jgi:hypothetical protein